MYQINDQVCSENNKRVFYTVNFFKVEHRTREM